MDRDSIQTHKTPLLASAVEANVFDWLLSFLFLSYFLHIFLFPLSLLFTSLSHIFLIFGWIFFLGSFHLIACFWKSELYWKIPWLCSFFSSYHSQQLLWRKVSYFISSSSSSSFFSIVWLYAYKPFWDFLASDLD